MTLQRLKVSDNKRFLVKEDETPFFWLGDTAWELFHILNKEEAEYYLKNRAEKGFNVIQAVALAECDGIITENSYGRKPLLQNQDGLYDPTLPDVINNESEPYSYWDHMDYIIDKAEELGLYIALLPTWGDKFNVKWGKGPEIFNESNAWVYGKWIAERYKNKMNIIWVLGGDRPLEVRKHFEIINAMAKGIREVIGDKQLITFHPTGNNTSSKHVHEEEWLDFNMIQSGHHALNMPNYEMITSDYEKTPIKPTLDAEPRYEDHPINFNAQNGYFDDVDVRQGAYWPVFAGAFGHTYGHHSIWKMCTEPGAYFIMHWKDALDRKGASQMRYLRNLMESRPFVERVPDQSMIEENYSGANHVQATRGQHYAFVYFPNGIRTKINMGKINGEIIKAYWYNPRDGKSTYIGEFENVGIVEFMPPLGGRGQDWVLVMDDAAMNFTVPGSLITKL